jgi:hypothetical protein
LTLILFSFFPGWGEHPGKQGWLQAGEDMCGHSRKSSAFRDSAHTGLQASAGICMKKYYSHVSLYSVNTIIFIYIHKVQDVFASKNQWLETLERSLAVIGLYKQLLSNVRCNEQ